MRVADSGPGVSLEDAPAGHGLDNVRGRLQALYGAQARMETLRDEAARAAVAIAIPVRAS